MRDGYGFEIDAFYTPNIHRRHIAAFGVFTLSVRMYAAYLSVRRRALETVIATAVLNFLWSTNGLL